MKIYLSAEIFKAETFKKARIFLLQTDAIDILEIIENKQINETNFSVPTEDEIIEKIAENIKQEFILSLKKKEYKQLNNKEFRMIQYITSDL